MYLEKFQGEGKSGMLLTLGGRGHCTKGALCTPHAKRTGGMLPQENINLDPLRLLLVPF